MSVIFFGSSSYVLPIIAFLHNKYHLPLVVTTEQSRKEPVISYCIQNDIPFVSVRTLKDQSLLDRLRSLHVPVAILASFGLIVGKEVRDIFPKGIINIHPSLLPLYRGTTPVQTALLDGVKKTGVSIILLDSQVDHGPILAQSEEEIKPHDTSLYLYTRLFIKGIDLLDHFLDQYLAGTLALKEQEHDKATFTETLTKESGFLHFDASINTLLFSRMVHAYYPWPSTWTIIQLTSKQLRIKFLPGNQKSRFLIQLEGKNAMTIQDFINGYREMHELAPVIHFLLEF